MNHQFWLERWHKKEIAFHESEINGLLIKHFSKLNLKKGSRIFIPLCGKTLDISWLLNGGYKVVGIELSDIAVSELFDELNLTPMIKEAGKFKHYHAENIDIYVGDVFELTKDILGRVNGIYDRGALVALPNTIRKKYSKHIMNITLDAPQLVICYEYDISTHEGSPHAIFPDEIQTHYGIAYHTTKLEQNTVVGGIKPNLHGDEVIWLLEPY